MDQLAWYPATIDRDALTHYAGQLRLTDPDAVRALARAVAASPMWVGAGPATLLVRSTPQPALVAVGRFPDALAGRVAAAAARLGLVCAHLRYVDYGQAEQDCEVLAARLIEHLGRRELSGWRFAALPRGGHVVLGLLAYALGLTPDQLEPAGAAGRGRPVVVVDDCALTGARFGRFLRQCPARSVVFAHLYSAPALRTAIEAAVPRVSLCLAAQDLMDYGPVQYGDDYLALQRRWLARLDAPRYWVGLTEHVGFPWHEPTVLVWNAATERVEPGWRIVPPERCLELRRPAQLDAASRGGAIPVQLQPDGPGPLAPASGVLWGDFDGRIFIADLESHGSYGLQDAAADMWRGIVRCGSVEAMVAELASDYDADEATLLTDAWAFADDLRKRGLLVG